jgi:hypothetical protein
MQGSSSLQIVFKSCRITLNRADSHDALLCALQGSRQEEARCLGLCVNNTTLPKVAAQIQHQGVAAGRKQLQLQLPQLRQLLWLL